MSDYELRSNSTYTNTRLCDSATLVEWISIGILGKRPMSALQTGLVFRELYLWHNTGNYVAVAPFGNPVQPHAQVAEPETKRCTRIRSLSNSFIALP